jgi:hypothetical protein
MPDRRRLANAGLAVALGVLPSAGTVNGIYQR